MLCGFLELSILIFFFWMVQAFHIVFIVLASVVECIQFHNFFLKVLDDLIRVTITTEFGDVLWQSGRLNALTAANVIFCD